MSNTPNNTIDITYDKFIYDNKPIVLSDFLNNKFNNVHKQLFDDAMTKYIVNTLQTTPVWFYKTHKVIEIKNTEYSKPSSVFIIDKVNKSNVTKVDLSNYWNDYQFENNYKDVSYIYMDEDTKNTAEVIYIDYVNGKTKLKSRYTQEEFWVDNKYINSNTKLSYDFVLSYTFTNINKTN